MRCGNAARMETVTTAFLRMKKFNLATLEAALEVR